jgi:hypothetical protein
MKTRFKVSLLVLLGLAWSYVLHWATVLMNMPSDLAVLAGFAIVLSTVIFVPTITWLLIRRKKSNDSQTNATN